MSGNTRKRNKQHSDMQEQLDALFARNPVHKKADTPEKGNCKKFPGMFHHKTTRQYSNTQSSNTKSEKPQKQAEYMAVEKSSQKSCKRDSESIRVASVISYCLTLFSVANTVIAPQKSQQLISYRR